MTATTRCLFATFLVVSTVQTTARALPTFGGPLRPIADITERLPIDFIENLGQWSANTRFVAQKGPIAAAFETRGLRLRFDHAQNLTMNFENASDEVAVVGERKRRGVYNYFVGNERARWQSGVPAYAGVLYRALYDGIDVRFHQQDNRFEYDVLVGPQASLDALVIRVDGASRIELSADGSLLLHTPNGVLQQTAPTTYEVLPDGTAAPIPARFRIIDGKCERYRQSINHLETRRHIADVESDIGERRRIVGRDGVAQRCCACWWRERPVIGGQPGVGTGKRHGSSRQHERHVPDHDHIGERNDASHCVRTAQHDVGCRADSYTRIVDPTATSDAGGAHTAQSVK